MERRTLDPEPVATLEAYRKLGGGRGREAAARLGPAGVVDDMEASGLRGRGGAGFPTGRKWRTVVENLSPAARPTVVVNAAEGEPGSFKDRLILRRNPYKVLEGALVAAATVGADRVVVAMKATFTKELDRMRAALGEAQAAGWTEGLSLSVVEGPSEYLYGEETALLEVLDGRHPFPRISPPFRRGLGDDGAGGDGTRTASDVELAGPDATTTAAPTLVNNVETMANVAAILAEGPDWFRTLGTADSPGTVVCTVSGRTQRHGVGEFAMGTPLGEVLDAIGKGPSPGTRVVAVMSGVANPLVPGSALGTPVSYEGMEAIGTGLGAAGFIVFDDTTDMAALAHGVARFLAIESCGQCTPCKQDGLAIAKRFDLLRRSEASEHELAEVEDHLRTVADEARCFLAHQHQRVVQSVLALFPEQVRAHAAGRAPAAEVDLVAPILDIEADRAVLDERHLEKQPDWTYGQPYSGQSPADRVDAGHEGI
ncbi:MAG: NADH-ubiquinone oxidoreductase-F iron-sulfur binding region domain-containing protein [Acidimicrobiales bacterium]